MRIAICDDEKKHTEQTAVLLEEYFRQRPLLEGEIETFQNSRDLLERVGDREGFDLYILDILLPEISGIDTGRKLRKMGDRGEIIYLTHTNDFAADSYDVHAFFYLLKPVKEEKLYQVLDGVVEKLQRRQNSAVVVNTTDGPRRILMEDIYYVERVGRIMRYYCTDGTIDSQTIRVPFRQMAAPLLADRRFCLCGASFVLNFQHVIGVNKQEALLDDGRRVTLPRTAAADFKMAWGNYWLEQPEGM
nr:LytTR family DNA-binding domain-containing protein [Anaerotignum lactatifermentans]